ncbi:MAG: flavodoxin family protein [Solobacterium sp.]|nr:flavodoxin family protein [Solobacterium sp.]
MKVLMLNGSRKEHGCTYTALNLVGEELNKNGIDYEIVHVGKDALNGSIGALVKQVSEKLKESDGLVIGSPVYFAGPSAELKAVLDRIFMSCEKDLRLKPAAAVASARRAGTTATLDVLNKYLSYTEMPIVTSRYWNMVHGFTPEDVLKDEEGVQIMRVLGQNMAWILKSFDAAKKAGIQPPEAVTKTFTNFIS